MFLRSWRQFLGTVSLVAAVVTVATDSGAQNDNLIFSDHFESLDDSCAADASGAIEMPAEVDRIGFPARDGWIATLTLVNTEGFSDSTARARLFSPTGDQLTFLDGNSQRHSVVLTGSGEFVLEVQAANLISTGGYRISVTCIAPVDPITATIQSGGLVSDVIETVGEVDQIAFSAEQDQICTFTLVNSSDFTGANARARVFQPSGPQLTFLDGNSQRQSVSMPESGTFAIQLQAANLVGVGGYSFGVECSAPPVPADGKLTPGDLVDGTIVAAGEVDQITFAAEQNQICTFTLVNTADFDGTTARARLFQPSGPQLTFLDGNSQRHSLAMAEDGTHVLQIQAANLVGAGGYRVGVECVAPPAPVDASLSCKSGTAGSIDQAAEVDQSTFDGVAGQLITITQVGTDFAGTAVRTRVFSPTGTQITFLDGSSQRVAVELSETGVYVFQTQAVNLTASGSYNLDVDCILGSNTG